MKKNYVNWSFCYLEDKYGKNVITGNMEEADEELTIPCFDGISYFNTNNKYYVMIYPKYKDLTSFQKELIEDYCGYRPNKGEYGVIAGALGELKEIDADEYYLLSEQYPT